MFSWKSWLRFAVAFAALGLLDVDVAHAQRGGGKGGGGGVPEGKVYYSYWEDTEAGWYNGTLRINPDGSNAAEVFAYLSVGEPSHGLHAGQRWFIYSDFHEINVVSEDRTFVELFNDPDIMLGGPLHWQRHTNDGWISFEADLTGTDPQSGQPEVIDTGIFVIQLAYDKDGAIVGAVPGSRQLIVSRLEFGGQITGHDWGADGRLLFSVIDAGENSGLWIADLTQPVASRYTWVSTGATRSIARPAWSPDGSRVGFDESSTGIVILNLSNGRRKTINKGATYGVGGVCWSPNGDGLIYQHGSYRELQPDVYRANRDGGSRTFLATGSALGWRE